jgi:hypothetical protein
MGARAVRAVDWLARGSRVALAASVAAVAIGTAADFGYSVPLEVAIERTLAEAGAGDRLDARARAALDADDVALARGLADLANDLGRPLPQETAARLAAAEAPAAVAWRNARSAAHGFVTGEIDGAAALGGAVAADFSLYGDLRDLAVEGVKMARGEEHSELLMGLAAAGLLATAATVPSLGGAAPAKFGVSVLKAARRAGTLTAEFSADLGRRLTQSAAKAPVRAGADAAAAAEKTAVRGGDALGGLAGATADLRAVGGAVGAGETVRLMKYVRSVDDLADLRRFTARFGARSRAVAELIGKASLRAFRTTIRLTELLLRHLWAAGVWFGSLLAGAVSNLGWRGVRFAAARM